MIVIWSLLISSNIILINGDSFGYGHREQLRWRAISSTCAGYVQSPILINSSQTVEIGMPALEMIGYHNMLSEEIKLHNNGHSVSLSLINTENRYYEDDIPYIFGALLNGEYQFESLHFHWGERNNRGSEHILNDIRYPLEMHLVHRNVKYVNFKRALKHKDGLTVLAVFFQLREKPNKNMEEILEHFESVKDFDSTLILETSLTLSSLLPSNIDHFYTYKGSLTTPPCSEVVTWIIFPEFVTLSNSQMDTFRILSRDEKNSVLADNYRHLQPIGKRKVFKRNPTMKNSKYFSSDNFLKWNWFN